MRTNIDIDDELMDEAIKVSGEPTKRAVVERAFRLLIQPHGQAGVRQLRGKVEWRGNLDESRRSRARTIGCCDHMGRRSGRRSTA